MAAVNEADEICSLSSSGHLRSHSSEEDFTENMSSLETEETIVQDSTEEEANSMETKRASALMAPSTRQFQILGRELTSLQIPKRGFEVLENEKVGAGKSESFKIESATAGQETTQAFASKLDHTTPKQNSSDKRDDDSDVEAVPEESILKRINSLKGMKSYQLGKQLSCKWTTGAGPRIGCVRDYPSELQFRALEQVSLSPRSGSRTKSSFAPRTTSGLSPSVSSVASLFGDTAAEAQLEYSSMSQRGEQSSRSEFSPLIRGTSVIPVIHMSE